MKKTGAAVTMALALSGIGLVGATGVAGAAPVSSTAPVQVSGAAPVAPHHIDAPQAKPMSDADRQAAIDAAVGAVSGAWAGASGDGQTVGGLLGVAIGCPLGALTGGTMVTIATFGVGAPLALLGGCIIGASGFGLLGTAIGSAVNGAPAALNEANNQYNKLHAAGAISAPIAMPAAR